MQRAFILVAVMVVVLASCGGDDAGSSPPSVSTTSTTVPAQTSDRNFTDLQAIADAAGDALIFVSDDRGASTVVSGRGDTGAVIEPDDAFFLGSGSKMITAATILRLVDQGAVGLDDLLADYVDFEVATPITIRHLLQHTSGLPDDNSVYDSCDPDEVMDRLAAQAIRPYNMEPGRSAAYATNGFNMLSLVMSAATGQSAAEVVRTQIFEPLGMASTFFAGPEEGPQLVVGQGVVGSGLRRRTHGHRDRRRLCQLCSRS